MADTPNDSLAAQDAIATPSRPHLLNIPPELFERIAKAAEPQDQLNLRLVCKEANEKVLHHIIALHFTERAFLLCSEDSLRTLLSIASHERFAKSMRKIVLCVDEVAADEPRSWRRPRGSEDQLLPDGPLTDEQRAQRSERYRQYEAQLQQQAQLRAKDVDLHLLTMAFLNFKLHGNVVQLQIADCDFVRNLPIREYDTILNTTGRRPWTLTKDDARPFTSIMEALALSEYPVNNLTLRATDWRVHLGDIAKSAMHLRYIRLALQHVRFLDLDCDFGGGGSGYGSKETVELINSALGLTHLTLRTKRRPTVDTASSACRSTETAFAIYSNFPCSTLR